MPNVIKEIPAHFKDGRPCTIVVTRSKVGYSMTLQGPSVVNGPVRFQTEDGLAIHRDTSGRYFVASSGEELLVQTEN